MPALLRASPSCLHSQSRATSAQFNLDVVQHRHAAAVGLQPRLLAGPQPAEAAPSRLIRQRRQPSRLAGGKKAPRQPQHIELGALDLNIHTQFPLGMNADQPVAGRMRQVKVQRRALQRRFALRPMREA
jgi:hypothetical protein